MSNTKESKKTCSTCGWLSYVQEKRLTGKKWKYCSNLSKNIILNLNPVDPNGCCENWKEQKEEQKNLWKNWDKKNERS